jgi:hypothetical protein
MPGPLSRRALLLWLMAALLGPASVGGSTPASSDSGSGGGGSSGNGGGGGNSGKGGGDDSGKGGGDDSGKGGDNDGGDDDDERYDSRDYQRAKDAVRNGESRPLPEILGNVSILYPGKVVDVRLNRRKNGLMYDVKVITLAGKLIRVRVDAASGAIVGVRGI